MDGVKARLDGRGRRGCSQAARERRDDVNDGATLDDVREAVATLVEIERTSRRVLGGAHPTTQTIEGSLRHTRAVLRARETPSLQVILVMVLVLFLAYIVGLN